MSKSWRWERREKKRKSKRERMPVSGRSVFIIQQVQQKRANKIKEEKDVQPTD